MSSQLVIIYVPCKDLDEAKKLARNLLEQHLIGCANIIPSMVSLYNWNLKVEENLESLLVIKTIPRMSAKVKLEIEKQHSYSTPCIMELSPKSINHSYLTWLTGSIMENQLLAETGEESPPWD